MTRALFFVTPMPCDRNTLSCCQGHASFEERGHSSCRWYLVHIDLGFVEGNAVFLQANYWVSQEHSMFHHSCGLQEWMLLSIYQVLQEGMELATSQLGICMLFFLCWVTLGSSIYCGSDCCYRGSLSLMGRNILFICCSNDRNMDQWGWHWRWEKQCSPYLVSIIR